MIHICKDCIHSKMCSTKKEIDDFIKLAKDSRVKSRFDSWPLSCYIPTSIKRGNVDIIVKCSDCDLKIKD